jgi:hypothetical protein
MIDTGNMQILLLFHILTSYRDLYLLPAMSHYFLDLPQGKNRASKFLARKATLQNGTYAEILNRYGHPKLPYSPNSSRLRIKDYQLQPRARPPLLRGPNLLQPARFSTRSTCRVCCSHQHFRQNLD